MLTPKGFFVDPPELTIRGGKHYITHCGCCESFHPADYTGDCRSDANRYGDYEDYAERNNIAVDLIVEVD
jgi:hypothetical protein